MLKIMTVTISAVETVSTEPNKNASALPCESPELISVIAMPTESVKITESTRSVFCLSRLRTASIKSPQIAVKKNAPSSGVALSVSATVTPASDACESVSPIKEYFRNTKKIPMSGQSTAIKSDTTNA